MWGKFVWSQSWFNTSAVISPGSPHQPPLTEMPGADAAPQIIIKITTQHHTQEVKKRIKTGVDSTAHSRSPAKIWNPWQHLHSPSTALLTGSSHLFYIAVIFFMLDQCNASVYAGSITLGLGSTSEQTGYRWHTVNLYALMCMQSELSHVRFEVKVK